MDNQAKDFDAVAESRKWREAVQQDLEGLNEEQVDAYFQKVREDLQARQQRLAVPEPAT